MPEEDHREAQLELQLDLLAAAREAPQAVDTEVGIVADIAGDIAVDIDHHTGATDLMFQSTITLDLMVMLLS